MKKIKMCVWCKKLPATVPIKSGGLLLTHHSNPTLNYVNPALAGGQKKFKRSITK